MQLSYWENETWFSDVDFCIVGSGIVGLSCALRLREKYPKSKIIVVERGILPKGASTKNAGFACFGSLSEIISDLQSHSEQDVINLVRQRYAGLQQLRRILGDTNLGYKPYGGYEIFLEHHTELFELCLDQRDEVNAILKPVFGNEVFTWTENRFNFKQCKPQLSFNSYEGQIDVGKMMRHLLKLVYAKDIMVLNGLDIQSYQALNSNVDICCHELSFKAKHLLLATNAFAQKLLNVDLKPSRNQVLVTKPIKNLQLQGTFHLNEGYYYFRNIDQRILLGGGRHLDFEGETTEEFGTTTPIMTALEKLLKNTILPQTTFEIDQVWSGILGVGAQKQPIVKSINHRVHCAVRLGGMGVAIGSEVGRQLAELP